MTPHLPTDRFRVGDIWRSPRGKDWQCDRVENGMTRLRSVHNPGNTRWRGIFSTGREPSMLSAWQRITPPQEN